MSIKNDNLKKLKDVFKDVNMTDKEKKTIEWLADWEPETIDNLCSVIVKSKII